MAATTENHTAHTDSIRPAIDVRDIPLEAIRVSTFNPRKHHPDDRMQELVASVAEHGVIQPIVVRPNPEPASGNECLKFEIVAGERRFRAACAVVGMDTIPAVVRDLSDLEALEMAGIENLQRADLNPLEEAEWYRAFLQANGKGKAPAFTIATLAARAGLPESHITRRVKLLTLEDGLQQALREDRLSIGHAEKLLRLDPAKRNVAADPKTGVVWRHSPLLEPGAKWVPSREDLRPLADLEQFIRDHSAFDPTAPDARHLTPGFGEQLDILERGASDDESKAAASGEFVLLSLDPLARNKLGAGKTDRIPLTPSKWREVSGKKTCDFAQMGVIAHGGPARILQVCLKRSCATHWPVANKKTATTSASDGATSSGESDQQRWAREDQERDKKNTREKAFITWVLPQLAKHLARVKFGAAVVRQLVPTHTLARIDSEFGVKLTEKTAAQVLLLQGLRCHFLGGLQADARALKFDIKSAERRYAQELKAQAKAAEKPTAAASKKPADATTGSSAKRANVTKGNRPKAKGAGKKAGKR